MRHGQLGVIVRLRLCDQRGGALHVDGHFGRQLVQAVAGGAGEQRGAVRAGTHGAPGGVGGVEEGLGRGVGVRRTEDAGAQPVTGDHVGLVEGEIGDQLDGAPGAVGGQVFRQPVEARA